MSPDLTKENLGMAINRLQAVGASPEEIGAVMEASKVLFPDPGPQQSMAEKILDAVFTDIT